jgi:hypothetical protein
MYVQWVQMRQAVLESEAHVSIFEWISIGRCRS